MYRVIAVASLIASASLAFVYSGFTPHAPWLRALETDPADVGGPLQPSPTRDGAMGGNARRDDPAADRPTSGDAAPPHTKAAPPGAEDGHWVFIKSASDYEAKLRTADALATTLAEKLSDTERSAAAQIESTQRQLTSEQARSADLDRALARARQGAPGQAGGAAAQAPAAAGDEIATLRTSLQAAADKMADMQSAAAAQADALQRRIGDEQARASGLDRALNEARGRVTQDEKQRSAADPQAAALTSALAATKLQMADLQRGAAQAQDLSKALAAQRARSADLAHDLSDARASLAQAVQKGAADGARAGAAESAAAAAKSDAARLQSAQDALTGRLAELERRAPAQAAASQETADQKTRIAALDQDAAKLRGLLAQAAERASAADEEAAALRDAQRNASDKLTSTERAFSQRLVDTQARLGAEQAKSAGLEKDLAGERARAARSDQAEASAEAGRQSSEAGARDALAASDGALQALHAAAAEAERKAAAQIGTLKAQAASAEARATVLDRDGADLRDRTNAAEEARGEAERRLKVALADRQAAGDPKVATDRADALQGQLEREKARAADLGRDLDAARTGLARAAADKGQQLVDAQVRLGAEQAKSAGLEKDLAGERARAAQADAGRRSSEAGAKDALAASDGALQTLRGAAAEAEHKTTAQIGTLKAQAASAEDRAAALDRDAAELRDRASAAEQARGEAERRLKVALADRQAAGDPKVAMDRADALQGQLEREKARAAGLGRDLDAARIGLAQAAADKGQRLVDAQVRLGAEQAKSAGLEKDLAGERARAAQADAGRQSSEAGARDALAASDGALQTLRGAAAEAEHKTTAQIGTLKAQAASAEDRAAALDRDAAELRDRASAAEQARGEAERRLKVALADERAAEDLKAAAGQRDALQDELAHEKARAAGLGRDLDAARTDLARAAADKADGVAADRRRDDADRALAAKLTEAERSAAERRARADDAVRLQQAWAAQLDAAKAALAQEQVRSAGLDRDLAEADSAIEQAAKRRAERQAAADKVAEADRQGAATAAGPQRLPDAPPDRGDRHVPARAPAVQAQGADVRSPDGGPRSVVASAVPDGKLPDAGGAGSTDLPRAAEARVSLLYARDSAAARERAVVFREALRARGIDVADPVPVTASIESDRVLYYYAEDKGSAERIANGLVRSGPVRRKLGKQAAPPPKPGTIEVSVAG